MQRIASDGEFEAVAQKAVPAMIELIIGGCTAYYAWKKKCAIDKYWNVESMTEAEKMTVGRLYFEAHPQELEGFVNGTAEEQAEKILQIMREASIIMEQNKPNWYTPMGKQEDNKQ